ncbi:tRNA pseudouridine(55) synthase TruB [Fusobacterium mortiferum]|uniref:tRNA pseudouridine synthase B n=1 Tax=Fusobacterium mortiferum TaxID=850 RepID=A0A414PT77_FUSMR|nr:tRNA pseudouridine(55) synthase TruB [Fusobacterium mortiferum]RHF69329.1 tRNA pseudouridine(55) synthase TruB [Fusobacterium mortiferum]RHF71768.1 tRNA pseudouridine(55) synthase TruB [Fusobacterium mortiferum]
MEGIININKPSGITSFDVIRVLRRVLKEKRIGHTGTLDPLAEGVLVVCLGRVTRLVQDIEGYSKIYTAGFELGYRTDTYDIEGKTIEESEKKSATRDELDRVLKKFIGDIKQIPPMYSALKVDGQKLYDLARKGIEVERKARDIHIDFIEVLEFDGVKGKIRCGVSKGTYIRSLIDDMGRELGTLATMNSLVREKVGDSSIDKAFTLEDIERLHNEGNSSFLQSVEEFFTYPQLEIEEGKNLTLFLNGNTIRHQSPNGRYRVYCQNKFLGLANVNNNLLKGYKYF